MTALLYNVKQGEIYTPPVQIASASGAINIAAGVVRITKAGVAAMTLADPATDLDGVTLLIISETAQAHTVSNAAGSGFNAGGAASDVGTFAAAIANGLLLVAGGGVWYVVNNVGVTLA